MLTKRSAAEPRPRFCLRLIDLQDQTKKQIKEVFYSIKQDYSPAFKSFGLGRAGHVTGGGVLVLVQGLG